MSPTNRMSVYKERLFPDQYNGEVADVIKVFSFKQAIVVGSASLRSQLNAGDYDMGEEVKVASVSEFCKDFTEIVKNIYHTAGLYLGDIKCGVVPEWSVIKPEAEVKDGKVVDYNSTESKRKLDDLKSKKIISEAEYKEAYALLGNTPEEFLVAKKEIKFDVVRWTYSDVVAGFTVLRDGRKMELGEAIQTPGLCKVDAVGWVENKRYSEFSCIYSVVIHGKVVNPVEEDLEQSLKNDMLYYVSQGKYFKYAKRLFAFAKAKNDKKLGETLTPLLNGELGRLYQMSGDMATLEWLIENQSKLNAERIHYEVAGFKTRLGSVYSVKPLEKNEGKLVGTLKTMEKLPPKDSTFVLDLERVKTAIDDAYNSEAKKELEALGLIPIPTMYGAGRGGAIPPRADLQQIVKNAYSTTPAGAVSDNNLVKSTNGLKFYQNGKDIIVGIRGTHWNSKDDLLADLSIGYNGLKNSNRFKQDLKDLQEFQSEYPPTEYNYYGVGHSLGGSILDEFIRMGLIKDGTSYNPAVQPQDIEKPNTNKRIYNSQDPLYKLMGRFTKDPEVRESGKPQGLLDAHALKNFEGGGKPRLCLYGAGSSMKVDLSNDFYGGEGSRITIHTPNKEQMKKFVDIFCNVFRKHGGSAEDINKIKSLDYGHDTANLVEEVPEKYMWYEMPDYHSNEKFKSAVDMFLFYIKSSPKAKKFLDDLEKHIDVDITESTHYLWFPKRPASLSPYAGKIWEVSKPVNPKYPIYIISKGRWEKRYTSKYLEWAEIPYKIGVEEEEYDEYAKVIDPKKIITFKKKPSEKDKGGIPARNFVLDHAKKSGAKRHWILDDNILDWRRNFNSQRVIVKSGAVFRVVEDYVDRYSNIMLAGHNYTMFVISQALQPITFNTRVYSSILVNNDIPFRWRGRYNEDTDLSLQCLKAGYPTVLFNAMVANKVATLSQKGGNTDSVYAVKDALYLKAKSLADQHPDVAIVKKRFGRTHHYVDYSGFKDLELKFKPGVEAKLSHRADNYGMRAVDGEFNRRKIDKEAKEATSENTEEADSVLTETDADAE